jgi:hypothetical protein
MLSTNDQMASGSVLPAAVARVAVRLIDGGPTCGGSPPDGANSENCESGCQFAIPSRHHIAGDEAAAAQALADFFFRENAQTRCTPVKVDHRDNAVVLAKCTAKDNLKRETVSLLKASKH